jgi:hypothetical protein
MIDERDCRSWSVSLADSKPTGTHELAHSRVTLETAPVGVIARVEPEDGRVQYAGPLPDETVAAIAEVSV